ncbi:MAG TPA: hypothetical protein DDY88_05860 [Actinobacteria bacterium]|nr:hypothetical protein [Actinomycetota bacterium]
MCPSKDGVDRCHESRRLGDGQQGFRDACLRLGDPQQPAQIEVGIGQREHPTVNSLQPLERSIDDLTGHDVSMLRCDEPDCWPTLLDASESGSQ